MDVDTYRYLLSALIQVFGAVIALDVVVLVLKYQDVRNRLDLAAFELGKVLSMVDQHRDYRDFLSGGYDFEKINSEASLFQSLDLNRRDERIKEVENTLIGKISSAKQKIEVPNTHIDTVTALGRALPKMEEAKSKLKEKKTHYQGLADEMKSIPLAATKIMALPAATVVSFSILLCYADTLCETWLFGMAWGAVAMSAIVLLKLIGWARKLFQSP